jgi:hypothetical protein
MVRCSKPSCTWVAHPGPTVPPHLLLTYLAVRINPERVHCTQYRKGKPPMRAVDPEQSQHCKQSSSTTRRALECLPPRHSRATGHPRSTHCTPPARRRHPPPTNGLVAWAAWNAQDPAQGGAPGAARQAPTPTVGPMPPQQRGTGGSAPRLCRLHPVKAGGSTPNRTRCPALNPTRPRTGEIGMPPSGGETKVTRGTSL